MNEIRDDLFWGPWSEWAVAVETETGWEVVRGPDGWLTFPDREEAWRFASRLSAYPEKVRVVTRDVSRWRLVEEDA